MRGALAVTLATLAIQPFVAVALAGPGIQRPVGAAPLEQNGPLGWESFTRLDLLPYLAPRTRTFQASSADPTGNNDDGYTGAYSCLHRVAQGCLMAEHRGPGELESVWTAGNETGNVGASGRLMIELDGRLVVNASWPELVSGLLPGPFAFPFVLNAYQSRGGYSINVPMPFRHEMRVTSQFNPHYFHVVYRIFATSGRLTAWGASGGSSPPSAARREMLQAGTRDPKPTMGPRHALARMFALAPGKQLLLASLRGAGAITQLRLRFARYGRGADASAAKDVYEQARLRVSFDGIRTVDAPVGEFFGSGLGPARVRSLMFAVDGTPAGWMSAWWPMPFSSSAQISLYNASRVPIVTGRVEVRWSESAAWHAALARRGEAGYFHALGHTGTTHPGAYWTFLHVRGRGKFVGVTLTVIGANPPYYLEGNERAYVDGASSPQIHGTGTEDFFGGGWYFFFDTLFTLPLTGFPAHSTNVSGCPEQTCKTAYRVMIADAVPFSRSILYEIQHGPRNDMPAIYSSTAYWYQRR